MKESLERLLQELRFLQEIQTMARKTIKLVPHKRLNRDRYDALHKDIMRRRKRLADIYKLIFGN